LEPYLRAQVQAIGRKQVSFEILAPEAPRGYTFRAEIDPLRVERIITNLVENSAYWARQARSPTVTVKLSAAPTSGASDGVLIQVSDNGPGISAADRPYIFDRFFTTREEQGMGLGLYLTRRFVTEANGRIQVSSEPGSTTFSILLPVSDGT
jgi:signal transduction histidine kinase